MISYNKIYDIVSIIRVKIRIILFPATYSPYGMERTRAP